MLSAIKQGGIHISSPVIIKSSSQGMVMRLDPDIPFDELKKSVEEKFTESADFFKDAKVALAFEGRELTEEQEAEILESIDSHTQLKVLCIVEKELLGKTAKEKQEQPEELKNIGQFFKGTLRSGQILESETSIILIGDVEPGARVIARGNVVVLGRLKGTVYAGAGTDSSAFVAALYMEPAGIKIGEYTRKSRVRRPDGPMRPKLCRVDDGRICFETITKEELYRKNNHQPLEEWI